MSDNLPPNGLYTSHGWELRIERVQWSWRFWRRLVPRVHWVVHDDGLETVWIMLPGLNIDLAKPPGVWLKQVHNERTGKSYNVKPLPTNAEMPYLWRRKRQNHGDLCCDQPGHYRGGLRKACLCPCHDEV